MSCRTSIVSEVALNCRQLDDLLLYALSVFFFSLEERSCDSGFEAARQLDSCVSKLQARVRSISLHGAVAIGPLKELGLKLELERFPPLSLLFFFFSFCMIGSSSWPKSGKRRGASSSQNSVEVPGARGE